MRSGDRLGRGASAAPKRLCVVVPVHNEAENLPELAGRLAKAAATLNGWTTETIFVDDGSGDDSVVVLEQIRASGMPVGYVRLSRNFGHQAALCAGLEAGEGDAYVTLDSDLQHPPEEIPQMIAQHETGYDVVQMVRADPAAGGKGIFSRVFYRIFNHLSDTQIVPNAADFRLMGRRVRDVLVRIPEREKFLRGLIPSLGFRQVMLEYHEGQRLHGRPTYSFRASLRLARKALFDYSIVPLQAVFWLGMFISLMSFCFGLGHLITKLIYRDSITPGFTDTITAIFFLSGCILASLGTLGRYLMMILEQVRGRPAFVIMDRVPGGAIEQATVTQAVTERVPTGAAVVEMSGTEAPAGRETPETGAVISKRRTA
jgi:dolichol-phosphate mannosyltransferase